MSRAILYLDQSLSSTGWMIWKPAFSISGSWPLLGNSKPGARGLGFRDLWGHLDAAHRGHGITEIVHESPVFGAANQGEDELIGQIGLIGIIELFAASRSLEVRSHAVSSWRTTWFAKDERKAIAAKPTKLRNWKHRAMQRAAQYGFDPGSHDEAEAIAICDHDLLKLKIKPQWRERELHLESVA